jgi:CRP-like cAMP-binding protein
MVVFLTAPAGVHRGTQANRHQATSGSWGRDYLQNRLLASLSREQFDRLQVDLEPVRFAKGQCLCEAGASIRSVYFPLNGMLSLVSTTEDGKSIDVGVVGNEGMVGSAILGTGLSAHQVLAQVPTAAAVVGLDAFMAAVRRDECLQEMLLLHLHSLLAQVSQSTVCNHFHTIKQRLSRRLLATQDRINRDTFESTQELLADLLGARRSGVTAAASALQDAGLIRYRWGRITIVDRRGLVSAACECYRPLRCD